jgi:hypothetical protein
METLTHKAPANDLVRGTEQEAIDQVAQGEGKMTEIREAHKEAVRTRMKETLHEQLNAKGTDGAALMDDLPDINEAEAEVDKMADEREENFRDNVQVGHIDSAGLQKDANRSVIVNAQFAKAKTDKSLANEIDDHEHEHTLQATAKAEGAPPPPTGDEEVDKMMKIGSIPYRERGAMKFAGDKHTAKEYHRDYKEPVNRVRDFLDKNGENGEQLVHNAARNGEIAEVRQAIARAHFKKVLDDPKAFESAQSPSRN